MTRSRRVGATVWVVTFAWFLAAPAQAQQPTGKTPPSLEQVERERQEIDQRLKRVEDQLEQLKAEEARRKVEEEKLKEDLDKQKEELRSVKGALRKIPRSIHEYGPAGYVRRRLLDESPTNPTFRPTHVPQLKPPTTEEEKKKLVTAGSFPKSILIPGTDTSIGLGGFIRLNVLYSLDPMGDDRQFNTSTIPVPQQSGTSTNFDFSWSRLTLQTHTKNEIVDDVKTFLQADFFGSNSTLRVRWAYVDFSYVRAGQAASVFMDYDIWPNVIDPDGPDAMLLKRHPLVQVTLPLRNPLLDQVKLALGAEDPGGSITLPTNAAGDPVGDATNTIPDFTGHLRYDNGNGHVQVSGLVRRLTFRAPSGAETSATGYGVHFSADIHPWAWLMGRTAANPEPTPLDKTRFLGQVATGKGFSTYLENAAGGQDAAVNAAGSLEALPITIWTLGYEHWWSHQWTTTLSYGPYNISGISTMPGDTQLDSTTFMGNVIWLPVTSMWVGMEFQWGKRQNLNGQKAEAKRIMWGIHYTF